MKYLKIVLGLLGAILALPLTFALFGGIVYVILFICSILVFKVLINIILTGFLILGGILFLFSGYFTTVEFLEKHFKFFKKKL